MRQGRPSYWFEPRHPIGDRQSVCRRGLPDDAVGAPTEPLRETAEALRATGAEVAAHAADVGSPDGAARLIKVTAAAYGGIDILVNNVGGGRGGARVPTAAMTTGRARWNGT